MKSLIIAVLALLLHPVSMRASDRLNSDLLKSVVRVETAPNTAGLQEIACGFLAGADPARGGRVFLVTNKHVIGDFNYADANIQSFHTWIDVFFYRVAPDRQGRSYRATRIPLVNRTGQIDTLRVRMHPQPTVDLVAIDVTDVTENPAEQISYVAYSKSVFIPFSQIEEWQTSIGDEVIALGYPYGIRSLRNDYPVAKIAYVASKPGEELSLPFPTLNRANVLVREVVLEGKFLLVDGLITNGNSGGPVVLMGGVKVGRDPKTNVLLFSGKPIPNNVVGIVSAGYSGSGLSIVVSSDYILELVDFSEKH